MRLNVVLSVKYSRLLRVIFWASKLIYPFYAKQGVIFFCEWGHLEVDILKTILKYMSLYKFTVCTILL